MRCKVSILRLFVWTILSPTKPKFHTLNKSWIRFHLEWFSGPLLDPIESNRWGEALAEFVKKKRWIRRREGLNECYIRGNGGNFSLHSDFQAGVTRVRLISAQQVLFQILKLPQRKKKRKNGEEFMRWKVLDIPAFRWPAHEVIFFQSCCQ